MWPTKGELSHEAWKMRGPRRELGTEGVVSGDAQPWPDPDRRFGAQVTPCRGAPELRGQAFVSCQQLLTVACPLAGGGSRTRQQPPLAAAVEEVPTVKGVGGG